jgi:uncharacterized protein (DUF3084 family)
LKVVTVFGTVTNRQLQQQLDALTATVDILMTKADRIMTSQDDINAADAQIQAEVADLGTQDAAILAAQEKFQATIAGLQGGGVNTTQLVADTANLLQAMGASDATVAALTTAAGP